MNRCQRWTPALLLMAGLFAVQSTTCNAETRSRYDWGGCVDNTQCRRWHRNGFSDAYTR